MELIDKGTLYKKIKSICDGCKYFNENSCACCSMEECADAVVDAPAVDAVPVVRCKDCKYSIPNDGKLNYGARYCSRIYGGAKKEHPAVWDCDYCSGGERRKVQD